MTHLSTLDHPCIHARRRQGGFTFLGLLFLVAGLSVGLAALGTLWHTAVKREKERELLFVGDQYRRAIDSFWTIPLPADQPRRLPTSLDELLLDPRFPNIVRHLRRPYPDPITGKSEWGLSKSQAGGISAVYSLSKEAPMKTQGHSGPYSEFNGKARYSEWVFTPGHMDRQPTAASSDPVASEQAHTTVPGQSIDTPSASRFPGVDEDPLLLDARRHTCNQLVSAAIAHCKIYVEDRERYWQCRVEAGVTYNRCMQQTY